MLLLIKSELKMARAIRRAGIRFLLALAIVTATTLPAHAQDTPQNLATWSDLDEAVANAYAGLTHEFML